MGNDKLLYGNLVKIIDRYTDKFGKEYQLNENKFYELHMISNLANKVFDEMDCDDVEIVVDEKEKSLKLEFISCSVYIDDIMSSNTFKLSRITNSTVFSTTKDHDLRISFTINDLWETC